MAGESTLPMAGRPERVLVVGPRRGLLRALEALGVPCVVWTDRDHSYARALHVHRAPIAVGETAAGREVEALKRHGAYTHVIAGTEAAVLPAAVARRALGTRLSPKSTVLRCHDKLWMKRHLGGHGIAMTPFIDAQKKLGAREVVRQLGLPVVVKPRRQSGGRGVEVIADVEGLAAVERRGRLFERYVDAPEVSVESFVNRGTILFENVTEYARKAHVNVIPAGIEDTVRDRVLALNRRVIDALNISWGMTHVEFYLTAGGPIFGEIALRPPGGYIMEVLKLAWGFDAWRAFARVELDRPVDFPSTTRAHGAAVVLHPGAGTVAAVSGFDDVRGHEAVKRARLRVESGDRVEARAGVGQDVGHVLLRAATRAQILDAVRFVESRLRVEIAPGGV